MSSHMAETRINLRVRTDEHQIIMRAGRLACPAGARRFPAEWMRGVLLREAARVIAEHERISQMGRQT